LKNQRYFEPFILLAFLEKGLSFFVIGLLFGFRELCINLFEIPSGAFADLYGRRKAMVVSFSSYTVSFVIFGLSSQTWQLFLAMFFFSIGEAFRTGTHKAIIFAYLKSRGQENERIRIYGYTRSWSMMGSAVSAMIAAGLVFWTGRYSDIFWLCAIPSACNIINFLGYPAVVEGGRHPETRDTHILKHTWEAIVHAWVNKKQRVLLLEASGFEGVFKISKDYIQPVIKAAAVGLPIFAMLGDEQRTALLVGFVYSFIFVISSVASRQAHEIVKWRGSDDLAALMIWGVVLICYGALIGSLAFGIAIISIPLFLLIYLAQNIWRPLLVSRLNACSREEQAGTTLSIESQMKSTAAMVIAPVLGLAVDHLGIWAVGVLGFSISLVFWVRSKFSQQRMS
jgi:MFS family permease